jgi:3-dehydroquinate dehydratase-2
VAKVLLLNGPNLNLLGLREPEQYGTSTLADIENDVSAIFAEHEIHCDCYQSNAEHELINRIHQSHSDNTQYILFNPAAFTHTSVALRDALLAVAVPFVEVHLTDPKSREAFRHRSYFSDIARQVFSGEQAESYRKAAYFVVRELNG